MSGQRAVLHFDLIGGGTSPAEEVTIDGRCDSHDDCIRVIRANGYPAWASSAEIEVLA